MRLWCWFKLWKLFRPPVLYEISTRSSLKQQHSMYVFRQNTINEQVVGFRRERYATIGQELIYPRLLGHTRSNAVANLRVAHELVEVVRILGLDVVRRVLHE